MGSEELSPDQYGSVASRSVRQTCLLWGPGSDSSGAGVRYEGTETLAEVGSRMEMEVKL